MADSSKSAQEHKAGALATLKASRPRYLEYVVAIALLMGLLFIGATQLPKMSLNVDFPPSKNATKRTEETRPSPSETPQTSAVFHSTSEIPPQRPDATKSTVPESDGGKWPVDMMDQVAVEQLLGPKVTSTNLMSSTAAYDLVNVSVVDMDTSPSSSEGLNASMLSTTEDFDYVNMTKVYTETEGSSTESPGTSDFTTSLYNLTTAESNRTVPDRPDFPTEFELCNTSFCSREGAALENSFSTCCDPCDNFYGYVCRKNWPPKDFDFDYTDSDSVISQEIEMKIKLVLDGLPTGAPTPLANLWQPCNTLTNTRRPQVMQLFFLTSGFNPDKNEEATAEMVMESLKHLMNGKNIAPLLFVEIEKDPADNSKMIISLDEADVLISRQRVKANWAEAMQYMTDMSCIFFHALYQKPNTTLCTIVATTALELAEKSTLTDHPARRASDYEVVPYSQLPHIQNFLNAVAGPMFPLNNETRILLKSPSYVKNTLARYLKYEPVPLYNYVGFYTMVYLAPFLGIADLLPTTMFMLTGQTWQKPPRWRVCLHFLDRILPSMITALYEAPFKDAVEFEEIMGDVMAEQIRSAFLEELPNARFLDAWTRNVVKLKSKKTTIYSFFPLRFLTAEQAAAYRKKVQSSIVKTSGGFSALTAVLGFLADERKQPGIMRYFYQRSKASILDTTCRYMMAENAVLVPVGLFDISVPTSVREKMFHIPRIGPRIMRCLFQATFESSAFFDANDLSWTEYSKNEYEDRVKCFANQYKHERHEMSRTYSVIEDNAAIRVSYKVFQDQLFTIRYLFKDYRLENLETVTSRQLFFIYYARSFCQNVPPDQAAEMERENRVNVPLRNSPEFSVAYECPLGSGMNPLDKCRVWD